MEPKNNTFWSRAFSTASHYLKHLYYQIANHVFCFTLQSIFSLGLYFSICFFHSLHSRKIYSVPGAGGPVVNKKSQPSCGSRYCSSGGNTPTPAGGGAAGPLSSQPTTASSSGNYHTEEGPRLTLTADGCSPFNWDTGQGCSVSPWQICAAPRTHFVMDHG